MDGLLIALNEVRIGRKFKQEGKLSAIRGKNSLKKRANKKQNRANKYAACFIFGAKICEKISTMAFYPKLFTCPRIYLETQK